MDEQAWGGAEVWEEIRGIAFIISSCFMNSLEQEELLDPSFEEKGKDCEISSWK